MVRIENTVPPSPEQWMAVIHGMRNPMNSWDKCDSGIVDGKFILGDADRELAIRLACAGDDHGKFLRMLPVIADINAPLYWWKQFDTYKVGTVSNSCSTMHKLGDKPFELEDFSLSSDELCLKAPLAWIVGTLNECRNIYLKAEPDYWMHLVEFLPESYNQLRTVSMNYAVLRRIYFARKGHKLKEWQTFREWIETLPYSELITSHGKTEEG